MINTYHVYKTDCNFASRVYMQKCYHKTSFFIHKKKINKYHNNECNLNFKNLTIILFKKKENSIFIFHAQSSLIYLLYCSLIKLLLKKRNVNFIYDIHDLHEKQKWNSKIKSFRYNFVRYNILYLLETFVLKVIKIRFMTVSNGLAEIISIRYNCKKGLVVKNIPFNNVLKKSTNDTINDNEILFFGSIKRSPLEMFDRFKFKEYVFHFYGIERQDLLKFYNEDKLKNLPLVIHGRYQPNNLSFLNKFKFLILYKKNIEMVNYQISLPNKVFQAVANGLSVIVSSNFIEIIDTFSSLKGAIEIMDDPHDLDKVIKTLNNKRGTDYIKRSYDFINQLTLENKKMYLNALTF